MNERIDTNKTSGATTDRKLSSQIRRAILVRRETDITLQSVNHRARTRVRHLHGPESRQAPPWRIAHLTLVLALANHIKAIAHHCVTNLVNMEG